MLPTHRSSRPGTAARAWAAELFVRQMKTVQFSNRIMLVVYIAFYILALPSSAASPDNSPNVYRLVFLYNNNEYILPIYWVKNNDENVPPELLLRIEFGDHIGYRRYENEIIVEEVIGSVGKNEVVLLSNGIELSFVNMTRIEALKKLQEIYWMLHTPDFGHNIKNIPTTIRRSTKIRKLPPSRIEMLLKSGIVKPIESNND